MSALFTPLALRAVTLPNRVAMAPMCQYSAGPDLVLLGRNWPQPAR